MTPILAPQGDATARFGDGGFGWDVALIQVPDVGPVRSRTTAAEAWERSWAERSAARARQGRSSRRRLRREFRMAACLCLAFAPVLAALGAWGMPPVRRAAAAEVVAAAGDSDADQSGAESIRLSIKPVEAAPEVPVVFPGYLLPAERREEPSHEGS